MRFRLAAILVLSTLTTAALAAPASFPIGYLEDSADPRYETAHSELQYPQQPWGRAYAAAQVALSESRFAGKAAGLNFTLERRSADDAAGLASAADALAAEGAHFFVVDARGAVLAELARRLRGRPLVLLNISAGEDAVRGADCQARLLHVIPSASQYSDAVAQDLVSRKWREVLLLQGPSPADAGLAQAFLRSAHRFGLHVVDTARFVPGEDPRERERNDVALLTAGHGYDAVYVADADGEFASHVPYRTQLPRVVAGSAGLSAEAWSWAWTGDGAAQLNHRLEAALDRHAGSVDWAAWMAVKAVVEAVVRAGGSGFDAVFAQLTGDALALDGFKGFRMGFRAWDGQLRQPILLASGGVVSAVAPLEGFLDPVNNLDTLGFDARESACHAGAVQ